MKHILASVVVTSIITSLCSAASCPTSSSPHPSTFPLFHSSTSPSPSLSSTLASIDGKAGQITTLKAKFKQTVLDPSFDEKDESSGIMQMAKESGGTNGTPVILLRFDYIEPDRSATIIGASKVYVVQEGFDPEEYSLKDDVKMQSLLAAFTSAARMQEHFNVVDGGITNGRAALLLEPKSEMARKTFKRLHLAFSTVTWLLESVHQVKLNGQETTVEFKDIEENAVVPRAQFSADSLKAFAPASSADRQTPGDR